MTAGRRLRVRWDIEGAGSRTGASHAQIASLEDLEMRTAFDFAPYRRSTVCFDRLCNMLGAGQREDDGYPPFDIVKEGDDSYRITLAVAGFRPRDIEIVAQENQLTVTGKRDDEDGERDYLHRGIATRAFERRFQLADFIEAGDARFENGLLSIALKRVVPEAMKPRKIEIGGAPVTNDRLEGPQHEDRHAA